jgi:hypothetical protein
MKTCKDCRWFNHIAPVIGPDFGFGVCKHPGPKHMTYSEETSCLDFERKEV